MGNVRPKFIKNIARELLEMYPQLFKEDFNHNKIMVQKLTDIQSKKVRNMVAGYITHLIKIRRKREEREKKLLEKLQQLQQFGKSGAR